MWELSQSGMTLMDAFRFRCCIMPGNVGRQTTIMPVASSAALRIVSLGIGQGFFYDSRGDTYAQSDICG